MLVVVQRGTIIGVKGPEDELFMDGQINNRFHFERGGERAFRKAPQAMASSKRGPTVEVVRGWKRGEKLPRFRAAVRTRKGSHASHECHSVQEENRVRFKQTTFNQDTVARH